MPPFDLAAIEAEARREAMKLWRSLVECRCLLARRSSRNASEGGNREPSMKRLGLERDIVDRSIYDNSVRRFREAGILLPTFSQLAEPVRVPAAIQEALAGIDPDAPHPLNLFRVHWYNDASRRHPVPTPEHLVLPPSLTGVDARIVVALGDRFPMIAAHKVLAAYGCLAPRVITGQFDPIAPPGDLALDRQLLPRWRRDLPNHELPRRGDPARGHERGALHLARALGRRAGRYRAHAGVGEQRQGDLRQVRRARARPAEHRLQPVLRVRELPRTLQLHGSRPRARRARPSTRPDGFACRRSCRPPGRRVRSARATT